MKTVNKPRLSIGQIFNMSVGFLGIQFGFALQNGNASRVLQNFGADVEQLSWFWLGLVWSSFVLMLFFGLKKAEVHLFIFNFNI